MVMLENIKQITPEWVKEILLEDIRLFNIILNRFDIIENLKIRMVENRQKIEVYGYCKGKIFYNGIDNLNKENRELGELLETLKEV